MATASRKRTKGQRFAAVCALSVSNADFHNSAQGDQTQSGLHEQSERGNSSEKLVLYSKISSEVKKTISYLNLSVSSLRQKRRDRRDKIRICEHCITKLENLAKSLPLEDVCIDHSYAENISTDCSSVSDSVSTSSSLVDSDTESDGDYVGSPLSTSSPNLKQQPSSSKRQKTSVDKDPLEYSSSPNRGICGESIIQQLKALPDSEVCKVARYLGESQAEKVKKDSFSMSQNYRNIDYLTDLNTKEWLSERNPVVVNFVEGVSGYGPTTPLKKRQLYSIAKSVEQVYNSQPYNHVLPLSFSENAVSHSVVNSKLTANINGLSSPAGSYWTIKNWMETQASHPLPPPIGDCICAFDNDQVIGKTYHVKANNKVRTSVITSVCMAEVDPLGTLQKDSKLKPVTWSDLPFDSAELLDYDSTYHRKLSDLHYTEMYKLLQHHIGEVHQQVVKNENGSLSDEVDKVLAEQKFAREWKVCSACQHHNPRTKRLCETCRTPLSVATKAVEEQVVQTPLPQKVSKESFTEVSFSQESDKEDDAESSAGAKSSTGKAIHVAPRDPIFVNPNSFETVKEVFLAIGKDFQISKYLDPDTPAQLGREWLLIVCDGLPYTLAQKVIKDTFRCQECQSVIFKKELFEDHCLVQHNIQVEKIVHTLEFDWVHLRIGYGHYEMNMLRSFIELNWEVMVKDIAFCMGFRSENAQRYAKKGSDHHKSWEMLCILYEGSLQELLVPYIRYCVESQMEPTPVGYLQWSDNTKNPNYQYMQEQVLTYMQSILNFRKGVRNNDKDLIMVGKYKHAPIFHGRSHIKYQQIELIEARNDLIMPTEVKQFVQKYQSISQSGQHGRGEDMDFQLENINKQSKVWTSKGVPSEADWLRTFRNLENLDKMRSKTLKRMGCDDPKGAVSTSRHTPQSAEVMAWRVALRESKYLANPMEDSVMLSVSGKALDDQLVNFTETAWSRRRYLYSVFFEGADSNSIPDPIFVLPEERESYHDIKNQTKEIIAARIKTLVGQLQDVNVRLDFHELWTVVEKKRKEDYLLFHQQVKEAVDADSCDMVVTDNDALVQE